MEPFNGQGLRLCVAKNPFSPIVVLKGLQNFRFGTLLVHPIILPYSMGNFIWGLAPIDFLKELNLIFELLS